MSPSSPDIVLVDTAPRGGLGSMTRYARMVETAVRAQRPWASVERACLALPQGVLRRLPPRFATWIHHAWLFQESRRRLRHLGAGAVYHVLDGSYAYVARGLPASQVMVTCHDLIPYLQLRGVLPGPPGRLAAIVIRSSLEVLRRCAFLTAVSTSTSRDLGKHAGVAPHRITVVHPVLDPLFAQGLAKNALSAAKRAPWVLHLGSNAGYKNRSGVLDVFDKIAARVEAKLFLAGPLPDRELARRLSGPALAGKVNVCVNPSDTDLHRLYGQCRLLLFPSIYEGFGSPVLEAMASGCPVVCASSASLPEVTGGAALMAAAADRDGLASHCVNVLIDDALAQSLAELGLARALQFSSECMGEQFWSVYDRFPNGQLQG